MRGWVLLRGVVEICMFEVEVWGYELYGFVERYFVGVSDCID